MAESIRIFIGSSSEAVTQKYREGQTAVQLVEEVIKNAGMEPVVWNRDAFAVGRTLLETIESIPLEYRGAVLLATPDVSSERGANSFIGPVGNVVFEYGYLAGRLGRDRVAICRFENADIPSDLLGMKFVEIKDYNKEQPSALPRGAIEELSGWLTRLPRLAGGIPPISQVHGYSGTWNVQNHFTRWRDYKIENDDKVYFDGKTFLFLQADGKRGTGVQIGKLYVSIDQYRVTREVVNEVLAANVDEKGTLKMRVRIIRSRPIPGTERGEPSDPRFSNDLANKEFSLELEPVANETKKLRGTQKYETANDVFQSAREAFVHFGLFEAPGLEA